MKIDLNLIHERKARLVLVKQNLKDHFIGIDNIIEELMRYIQVWYLMPELLTRPVILNLWGMTGVGKTDLIRQLIKQLDFTDRYTEIELSNIDTTNMMTSVAGILSANDLNDDKPSVILFDEIQRFNTIDEYGNSLPQNKFTDFWELLSDGKLFKKTRDNIDSHIANLVYSQRDIQRRKGKGEEHIDDNPFLVDYWQYIEVMKILGKEPDFSDKGDMTQKELLDLLLKTKSKKQIYEPIDHSKTLIVISGNLDEAFTVATQTSEADVDADIFHNNTSRINLVDIKNALSKKFRPEQVARFGNIHLIYSGLRRVDFEQLIQREILRICKNIKTNFDITVTVDPSVAVLIYNNGVFPVQGVRPVFSSIIDILETNLSNFLLQAVLDKKKTITISYDIQKSVIECHIDKKRITVPFKGRMDKIRESNITDTVANISVHEAGHALVYILLFGIAPLQLKSKIASSYAGGFTFPHNIHRTKENIIKEIKVLLAGGIAEEIVFDIENTSIGHVGDRERATALAIDYVRNYGFDEEFQANYMLEGVYALDKYATDTDVEKMISRLVAQTYHLLFQYKEILLEISRILAKKGSMESVEVAEVARKHGIPVEVKNENYVEIYNYHKDLK